MQRDENRRHFLKASAAAAASLLPSTARPAVASEKADEKTTSEPVRVVVWDERQPAQRQVYKNFLGNEIADYLRTQPGLAVKSVALDDPQQGISDSVLAACDVLIWWGHARHAEVTPDSAKRIVARILSGNTSLIALHSAHWSTPFVEAMYERTRRDAERAHDDNGAGRVTIRYVPPTQRYTFPKYDARLTPYATVRKFPDGRKDVEVRLPYCCFPAYRHDGLPSTVRVLQPDHPIVQGIPRQFEISKTEMYDEPFHVPEPDEVLFEECWVKGEWFRSGLVWQLGKGRIFYFRPGHETYPVFKEQAPLKILSNAARWLGTRSS